ncbi:MAG: hypothetical protein O6918_13625, partial [Deltaproteobacteria bacterium]|nr:hypothetical protein [Deltaproteobacteria bacterium]
MRMRVYSHVTIYPVSGKMIPLTERLFLVLGRGYPMPCIYVNSIDRTRKQIRVHPYRFLGNPAACRGHKTDGVSPVESRSITPQGGEAVALPFGRPRGMKPRGRYNLIVKFFVILLYFVVNPVPRTYIRGFGALPLQGGRNIHPRA